MKRYQVITKCRDCGIDEKGDYDYILDTHTAAKRFLRDGYDSVYVYDRKESECAYAYAGSPEGVFSDDVDIKSTVIFWNPIL